MSILIIEDDQVTQKVINTMLTKEGYETQVAGSVKKAIDILKSDTSVNLIISDIMMPDADGFAFLEFRNTSEKYKDIPVLMSTSLGDKESVVKCISLGANDYSIKPINAETLLPKVKKLLEAKRISILIVDDDQIILDYLARAVEREGYKSLQAQSAEKALELMKTNKVDMVISDIALPEMNGFELLDEFKGKNPDLPVLLITGHSGKYREKDAMDAGADGYIVKPFRNNQIIEKIKSLISQPECKVLK